MTRCARVFLALLVVVAVLAVGPEGVHAYGGPGSVISGIGAFLAAVAALLAALFGFIWFPLKRLYQKMTQDDAPSEEVAAKSESE
jgi:preprotein translocase subunit SecG